MVRAAIGGLLPQIRDGARYVRAGVMLTGLSRKGAQQPLEVFRPLHERAGVGELLDTVSRRHGPASIGLGLAGLKGAPIWSMKRGRLSKRATTHWDELATVHAR